MAAEPSQHSGALVEQGSIDWVALSKSTVSFSVELLARYTGAGVQALTIAIGQALFAQFNVPADAQKRLELSVSKLKAFSSAANALWFGIGFKHVIRTMLETEQGATFVAVSSCLMVSYDREFSATVLKALCDRSSMPENLTPSLSQWAAFVTLCASAVTASQFPILVEGFSRLLVDNTIDRTRGEQLGRCAATSAGELAGALLEIAQLSTGKVASVTFVGRADCAWLAALAEWLFSLKVEIIDQTGKSLYQSKGCSHFSTSFFQLTIIRLKDGQSSDAQSLLRSRTYWVPPGDLFFNTRTETSKHLFYQGRSEWSTILNDTFSTAFQRLLEPEIISSFSQVLYSGLYVDKSAAALHRMNPWGDTLFTTESVQHQSRFLEMLRFATARLPELAVLEKYGRDHASELDSLDLDRYKFSGGQKEFERQFRLPPKGIKDDLIYEGFSTALTDACSCSSCNVVDKTSISKANALIPGHFCLSRVALTVFGFIWQLSWLDIDETIRPSSTGLISLYEINRIGQRAYQRRAQTFGKPAFSQAIMLLTGFVPEISETPSAIAIHGLCVYRPSLEHPALGVEGQIRLRVVPGQIERHGRLYGQIEGEWRPWNRDHHRGNFNSDETASVVVMLGADPLLQLIVEETISTTSLRTTIVALPENNKRVHWNYLHSPFSDRKFHIQYQKDCFVSGLQQLVGWIELGLRAVQCLKTHRLSETHPVWTTNGSMKPWSGQCSIMDLPWWTHDPGLNGQLLSIPRPNEWVIAVRDQTTSKIFRGSLALLYCILARLSTGSASPWLIQSGDCLICPRVSGGLFENQEFATQEVSIQSHVAGLWQKLDFRVNADRAYVKSELPT